MLKILMTFLSKPFRTITATESATGISTVFQTVDTTTTYLLACTNSEIHRPEDMCGGGDGSQPLPAFSFEAPTTPPPLGTNRINNVNKNSHITNIIFMIVLWIIVATSHGGTKRVLVQRQNNT